MPHEEGAAWPRMGQIAPKVPRHLPAPAEVTEPQIREPLTDSAADTPLPSTVCRASAVVDPH
jgi:hypothetical protein